MVTSCAQIPRALFWQDDECNILTVGSWYAMTGYGVAFAKNSKWIPGFNRHLMRYRENGDLERMQRRGDQCYYDYKHTVPTHMRLLC